MQGCLGTTDRVDFFKNSVKITASQTFALSWDICFTPLPTVVAVVVIVAGHHTFTDCWLELLPLQSPQDTANTSRRAFVEPAAGDFEIRILWRQAAKSLVRKVGISDISNNVCGVKGFLSAGRRELRGVV